MHEHSVTSSKVSINEEPAEVPLSLAALARSNSQREDDLAAVPLLSEERTDYSNSDSEGGCCTACNLMWSQQRWQPFSLYLLFVRIIIIYFSFTQLSFALCCWRGSNKTKITVKFRSSISTTFVLSMWSVGRTWRDLATIAKIVAHFFSIFWCCCHWWPAGAHQRTWAPQRRWRFSVCSVVGCAPRAVQPKP